jgi:hypothetical protein
LALPDSLKKDAHCVKTLKHRNLISRLWLGDFSIIRRLLPSIPSAALMKAFVARLRVVSSNKNPPGDRCPAGDALHIFAAKPLDAAARHHFSLMIETNPISLLLLVAIYWAFCPRAGLRKKLLHTPVPPALTPVNVQGRIHWSSVMFFRLRLPEGIRLENEIRMPSRE